MRLYGVRGAGPYWIWSWWTSALGLVMPTPLCLDSAMMIHAPCGDMMAEVAEVVMMARLPFWPFVILPGKSKTPWSIYIACRFKVATKS